MKRELNVVAALIKKGEKFLFCQRKKEDRYGLLWEFPGGSVEGHETFPAAIEREIKEELNLEVKAERLVGKFSDEDEELKIKIFLFICGIKAGTLETKECNDFGFFTIKEAQDSLKLAPADQKICAYLEQISSLD